MMAYGGASGVMRLRVGLGSRGRMPGSLHSADSGRDDTKIKMTRNLEPYRPRIVCVIDAGRRNARRDPSLRSGRQKIKDTAGTWNLDSPNARRRASASLSGREARKVRD